MLMVKCMLILIFQVLSIGCLCFISLILAAWICRVSKDLNCIQIVECVSEVSSRCRQLRSAVAYQSLLSCFDGV